MPKIELGHNKEFEVEVFTDPFGSEEPRPKPAPELVWVEIPLCLTGLGLILQSQVCVCEYA